MKERAGVYKGEKGLRGEKTRHIRDDIRWVYKYSIHKGELRGIVGYWGGGGGGC